MLRPFWRYIQRFRFLQRIGVGDIGRAFHHHDDEGGKADGENNRPVQDDQADDVDVGGGDRQRIIRAGDQADQ